MARSKTAGVTVYLMEELGDARLRCEQLKRYVNQALKLISQSEHKDHVHEVAGDLLYGIPDTLFRLDKALDATALAASRLDYEELRQELRPEKVNELEQVLKDVRIRHFDRRAPEENSMKKLATGTDVVNALRRVAMAIEADEKNGINPSVTKISNTLLDIVANLRGADETHRARFEEGKPADPTENMSEEDAKKWKEEHEKNKDNFKEADFSTPDPKGKASLHSAFESIKNHAILALKKYESGKYAWAIQELAWMVGELSPILKAMGEDDHAFRLMTLLTRGKQRFNPDSLPADIRLSRFEVGKPADPTENMSPEDAAKWKDMNEKYRDKFKS